MLTTAKMSVVAAHWLAAHVQPVGVTGHWLALSCNSLRELLVLFAVQALGLLVTRAAFRVPPARRHGEI